MPKPDEVTSPLCEHKYVFLRAEQTYELGYRRWCHDDVYFCEKCLTYRKVQVEHEERRTYTW